MSARSLESIKQAIAKLPESERSSLAHWINVSVIRQELASADEAISRGEGSEYDEQTLFDLFAETRSNALQLLRTKSSRS
jgi:hypothetical protein